MGASIVAVGAESYWCGGCKLRHVRGLVEKSRRMSGARDGHRDPWYINRALSVHCYPTSMVSCSSCAFAFSVTNAANASAVSSFTFESTLASVRVTLPEP
eukprot:3651827-Pyramimonas_sp.AAC.1